MRESMLRDGRRNRFAKACRRLPSRAAMPRSFRSCARRRVPSATSPAAPLRACGYWKNSDTKLTDAARSIPAWPDVCMYRDRTCPCVSQQPFRRPLANIRSQLKNSLTKATESVALELPLLGTTVTPGHADLKQALRKDG